MKVAGLETCNGDGESYLFQDKGFSISKNFMSH